MSDKTSILLELLSLRGHNDIVPITSSDTQDIPLCDGLLISEAGTIKILTCSNQIRTVVVPVG